MDTFTQMERLTSYRTGLLTEQQATSFGRCLRRNARFTAVKVCHSGRARGPKAWFVAFAPSNAARREALLQRQEQARAQRACEESFTFCPDTDTSRAFYWCLSHKSQEVYEVTEHSCSCLDFAHRMGPVGGRCKHIWALLNTAPEDAQELEPVNGTAPAPEPATNPNAAVNCPNCNTRQWPTGNGGRCRRCGRDLRPRHPAHAFDQAEFERIFG